MGRLVAHRVRHPSSGPLVGLRETIPVETLGELAAGQGSTPLLGSTSRQSVCQGCRLIRPFRQVATDQSFLWDMLFESIFVAPGEASPPRSVLDDPRLAHYVAEMGSRVGDRAWIAEASDATLIGAVWMRCLPADDPGYGFVDADTPEMGMAVVEESRGAGIGTGLLVTALASVSRLSLSVDSRNPAMGLYERHGFVVVGGDAANPTMLYRSSC